VINPAAPQGLPLVGAQKPQQRPLAGLHQGNRIALRSAATCRHELQTPMGAATGRRHRRRVRQGLATRPARVEPLPAAEHGETGAFSPSGQITWPARPFRNDLQAMP
jgi:hypothetical protein